MNIIRAACISVFFIVASTAATAQESTEQTMSTPAEQVSYVLGLDLGRYLSQLKDEVDLEVVKQGLEDGFTGVQPLVSEAEEVAAQQQIRTMMEERQQVQMAAMLAENKAAGEVFLAENRNREGVVELASGIQYEVLREGDGATPQPTDVVKVDYVGTLVDGSEFDSSISRGEPAVFPIDGVIAGWKEILPMMPVGSQYRVVIPSELAYGEQGAPPRIMPNSVLVFEIDLIAIEQDVQ
ncbi:MAG: FKBP-type peptidyl-prolyl cis-trans isomerase [Desulfofustis sp. PB-SRB1]|jgi:FKBP-type peptidyl-prolyl cis-trans isomerase|nr:FKBP-type peptidyl-prolyl cis-trans isomerase [Desulfofustis sp. PB-SRB1]MBM1002127.1 FKBP-type peptidyl-prolyl cis-trans isomerase [Desulfofustis sp. PB-SRB1]HBH30033.1 FKBP-type peptidyl-prolyl cis-trans isomerase [Desulfofustis sp.]HBH30820.1 FKBP-type peptidyl-prolyl cis-trans isomerase [Desulfofustis sp.]